MRHAVLATFPAQAEVTPESSLSADQLRAEIVERIADMPAEKLQRALALLAKKP